MPGGYNSSYGNQRQGVGRGFANTSRPQPAKMEPVREKDFVLRAERVMQELSKVEDRYGNKSMVTTTQLRRFLTAVNAVSGKIALWQDREGGKAAELPIGLAAEVSYLWVKLAYQIGKATGQDQTNLKNFEAKADLAQEIKSIGKSPEKYEAFARYVEALVAFHKFYGGKEK